ncbi:MULTISPECIES: efflux system transcriptional repressor EmhR [Pseudomonas]|jgi:TetR/AcrR family acrAB operon transcriptional repressor|uniref:Efflux system transcriptional repressor EmhR n=4 Tax=Pseudomonas chlororaphis TaxID=587753 RepID=A0AAQ1FPF6_9PSED|nr:MULTISPECIES: efflux system transcriptional repressor EmhR [Pseudomonas]AIC18477.1 TetR family transcriptional regulator [Pseudomonas chlororaphis]AIS14520.1 TetR family transcriptional regulator [Pseudomonas chlororaphis subsp. aurantiaca]AUG39579.1 TetR family transcriptional regulator [Pseudomonas chlororaphis]AZD20679.1 Multidrug resistance operon repressor MexR2, AcrR family [Pseudomonas chlororaphis subsp. aurantiaca]AZD28087.1 Multidrug resistance operon repressor MexR2, AcrR family 
MVRRTKEEAQETRKQILEAAEKAFYERGVARTTLADIAALAGVTRGAIYWHFSNKADLVQAMLDTLREPLNEMARASEDEEEVDPLGCMRKLLIHLFHQIALDPKTRRINEILFHKCEITDEMCDMRRQRRAASLDCNVHIELGLRNAVKRGQLPENLDTARAAISIHAYIDGILYQWLLAPDSFELHKEAERWIDTGLDMLRLSPSLRN